jgi:hypothetical protein
LVEIGLATTNVNEIESGGDKNVKRDDGAGHEATRLYLTHIDGVAVLSTATVTPIV